MGNPQEKTQADKFREAARELETDDDEKRFDERLKKIAKPSDRDRSPEKPRTQRRKP
ncbi:MAG: hypothetical protein BroJett030_11490 [Alphaproteobacteria bacterium]|nr:MAG: hypothetical protein BroJett030_11490 [Alphaproteobacteria bacterium]